jgi:hypothetical protein
MCNSNRLHESVALKTVYNRRAITDLVTVEGEQNPRHQDGHVYNSGMLVRQTQATYKRSNL